MHRNLPEQPKTPLPPDLLQILSLVDCFYRLGCSEKDAGALLDEWLEHGTDRVVGLVSGIGKPTGSRMAEAA